MNKIYRIVFNTVTGRWVVASELATGRKKQGGGERVAVAAVLVTGVLGSLMGAAHAAVVVNGNPQEATVGCELITDSGTTTWTSSTSAGACLAPVLAGSASGQGNPGADAIFYASNAINGAEDSLNLGGYLDVWKTATFHGGVAMAGQKITGLADGTAATDAATYGQLTDATRYMKINGAHDGSDDPSAVGNAMAIGAKAAASNYTGGAENDGLAVGESSLSSGMASTTIGHLSQATGAYSTALGNSASATATNAVALGAASVADRANTVSVGSSTGKRQIVNVANGTQANDAATFGQLTGAARYFKAGGLNDGSDDAYSEGTTVGIGAGAKAYGTASGYNPTPYNAGVAIGSAANASGGGAVAIGDHANATFTNIAIGAGADASGAPRHAMAMGIGSQATAWESVALGAQSVADRANTVSVGKAGAERQVVNVAKGTADTDSVNVSQLKGVTTALGGGAAVNADGTIKAPGYALANANTLGGTSGAAADVGAGFAKVDGALGALNTKVTQNTTDIAGNTTSINNLQNTVNNISSGTVGLVQQSAAGANLTVGKATDGAAVDFAGTAGARKLLNVADGTVAAGSKDAVNGGQLDATNQVVAANTSAINTLDGRVTTNEGAISTLGGRVTTNEGDISTLKTDVTSIDGRVTQNTTNIAGNTTSISNLQNTVNNISSGTVGLVQQSATGANLTVGKATDGAAVDFAGTAGARKLLNVADGTVAAGSKDAVNGGQLDATNQVVAANTSAINTLDGRVTTNEGDISSLKTDVTNIDGRVTTNEGDISTLKTDVTNIDGRMTTAEGSISTLNTNVSNIDGRVSNVEGSVTNITNQLSNGEIGLVQQDATSRMITVAKDSDGAAVDFAGTAGARKLLNVAAGTVAAGSKDAVNGGQLDATNQVVAANTSAINTLDGRVTTNEGAISSLDGRVTTNEGDISSLKTDVTNIDGRVTTAEGNITHLDNRVTTNEGDISTLKTDVTSIDGRVTNVEGSVTNITNQLNSGEIGLVQYDVAAGTVSVAKDKAGTAVDFRGTAGARRLKGVAAGGEDEDAVNVSQLKKIADAMGGGASVNADGSITAPTYYVTNADGSRSSVTNVGDAVSNIDSRVYNNTTAISTINQQISSGTIGMVQQASAGAKLTVGKDTDGAEVDFANNSGNARKLTSVADGTVAAGSKDAVNGGQLHAVSQSMASALGGGSVVNADGTISAPSYSVTDADGSTSQVNGVEGAISNIDNRTYQNTQAITNNTSAINNLSTQINNGAVGLVKQDAATRQITVAKDSDGTSVSVAGTAGDRVVTGVASARADNDAVNLGQLKAAGVIGANGESRTVVAYDDAGKTSMTMGGEGATSAVTIHNVADGVADHDAVNISQLNQRLQQNTTEVLVQANSYTDQKIDDVWTGMDKLATQMAKQDGRISQQGAMSMAESQMASGAAAAAVGNPNGAWSVGLGSEQGHGAISAGYAKPIGKKSQISFGAAFGGSDHSIGVGFAHRL